MSGLAHYFEDEGVPTVVVALIREQAEKVRPPRALWVPFPLGRPFGAPDNAEQQRRVLRRALALLEAPSGPVLVDFDEADGVEEEDAAWVCPVSFASPNADSHDIGRRVADEVTLLRPWYELGVERRGRTTLGLSNAPIEESAAWLTAFTDGRALPPAAPEPTPLSTVSGGRRRISRPSTTRRLPHGPEPPPGPAWNRGSGKRARGESF